MRFCCSEKTADIMPLSLWLNLTSNLVTHTKSEGVTAETNLHTSALLLGRHQQLLNFPQ